MDHKHLFLAQKLYFFRYFVANCAAVVKPFLFVGGRLQEDKKQMKILKPSSGKFWCFGKVVAYEKWSPMKVRL